MEITYIQVLVGIFLLLTGILGGIKLIPYLSKSPLTEKEVLLQFEIFKFAKTIYSEIKTQFTTEEEIKNTLVELITIEFPKIEEKIIQVIIDNLFEFLDKQFEE